MRGYTLIELLIMFVIFACIIGVVIDVLRGYDSGDPMEHNVAAQTYYLYEYEPIYTTYMDNGVSRRVVRSYRRYRVRYTNGYRVSRGLAGTVTKKPSGLVSVRVNGQSVYRSSSKFRSGFRSGGSSRYRSRSRSQSRYRGSGSFSRSRGSKW